MRPKQRRSSGSSSAAAFASSADADGLANWGTSNLPLHLLNPSSGEDRILGTLEGFSSISLSGLAVSPDWKLILYDRMVKEGHDLMLIENFR
jgi:hypothetical protein